MSDMTEEKRKYALTFASYATQLASPKMFPNVLKAVQADNEIDFKKQCSQIGIPDADAKLIWKIVKKESKIVGTMPAGTACW